MSIVSTGAADVADEPPEDRASHDAAISGLQVVRAGQNNSTKFGNSILGGEEVLSILQHSKKKTLPAEFFRLAIVEAETAVLHFSSVHDEGEGIIQEVEDDDARDRQECWVS